MRYTRFLFSLSPRELQSTAYDAFRRQFALCSVDDLQQHAVRLGKLVVQPHDRPEAHALLREACGRAAYLSVRSFRDMCTMATSASLYEECLQLFRARWSAKKGDSSFVPLDSVIDAAYHVKQVDDLASLATLAAQRLQKHSREVSSDFGIWRVMWRLACLSSASMSHPTDRVAAATAEAALEAAQKIWNEHIKLVNPPLYTRIEARADNSDKLSSSKKELRLVFFAPDLDINSTLNKGFDAVFRRLQRMTLYNRSHSSVGESTPSSSSGEQRLHDDGEMKFFSFCREHNFLRFNPQDYLTPQEAVASDVPPIQEVHVEQYFYALVGSCRKGLHVDQAVRYYEQYREILDAKQTLSEAKPTPGVSASPQTAASDDNDSTAPTASSSAGLSESFLFQVLSVLQAARAYKHILKLMVPVVTRTSQLSAAIWSQVLLAAGEEKNLDVSRIGYQHALRALQQRSFLQGDTVSSTEYLLQTSIHAMAKCYCPRLLEDVIQPCLDSKVLVLPTETVAYIMTQNAMYAPNAAELVPEIRWWMRTNQVDMSTRIASLMFKILLRLESDDMLPFYKEVLALCTNRTTNKTPSVEVKQSQKAGVVFKSIWLEQLILCADRRRYTLSQDDRAYIVGEIERVYGKFTIDRQTGTFSTTALEGLRTQVGILVNDLEFNPLQTFKAAQERLDSDELGAHSSSRGDPRVASDGITPPAPLQDPRMHFLFKRQRCFSKNFVSPVWCEDGVAKLVTPPPTGTHHACTTANLRRIAAAQIVENLFSAREDAPNQQISLSADADDALGVMLATIVEGLQNNC